MADTSQDQSAAIKELEARIHALETRLAELQAAHSKELQELDRSRQQSVRAIHSRLDKLENRHDQLRDHTTMVPESLWPAASVFRVLGFFLLVILIIASLARR